MVTTKRTKRNRNKSKPVSEEIKIALKQFQKGLSARVTKQGKSITRLEKAVENIELFLAQETEQNINNYNHVEATPLNCPRCNIDAHQSHIFFCERYQCPLVGGD